MSMHVVAITRLVTSIEEEAKALAADCGAHVYDERLKLAAGMPCVVLLTPDAELARRLHGKLVARGHDALRCSTDDVVRGSDMISLRRFALEPDALVATELPDTRLPWADLSALVRGVDLRQRQEVSVVTEKKFNLGRSIVTGGLINSKTAKKEVSTTIDESEQVLYLFRRSGDAPWILREQGTHYAGLGATLAPSTLANFSVTVEQLRRRAPAAAYDDRLVTRRRSHRAGTPTLGSAAKISSAQDLDLLAHLVARSIGRRDD